MSGHDIVTCPECRTPATKWFEFGGKADPHAYYHCDNCGRSCAVQQRGDGQPGRSSQWVMTGGQTEAEQVTFFPKPDRRKQLRIPPQAVAHRAYELHEQRGRDHGYDLDDWLRAERDLTRRARAWAPQGLFISRDDIGPER